jgi:hypothetical protein
MTDTPRTPIPNQPSLPLSVAIALVRQGIRIRLGRSVVTLLGVTLGIAFLMATLTTQVLRRGVAAEEARRETANRRYAALVSETGSLHEKSLAVAVSGPLDDGEQRLLARLREDGVKELRLRPGSTLPSGVDAPRAIPGSRETWAHGSKAIVSLGPSPAITQGEVPTTQPPPVVAYTRPGAPPRLTGVTLVSLSRPVSAEEARAAVRAAERERFRTAWIIAVSLLVTVIGIANSMLMSVTERFRDIGTMRCLGALSSFVRTLFLVEAAFMGLVGGALGALAGALFALGSYLLPYGGALLTTALGQGLGALALMMLASVLTGVVLSLLAAFYPASAAARMVPADALRSTI